MTDRDGTFGRSKGAASNYDEEESSTVQSFSTGNKSSNSKNSFFDPPIENYRFYYQLNDSKNLPSETTPVTGFLIKPRQYKDSSNDDDDESVRSQPYRVFHNKIPEGSLASREFSDAVKSEDNDI